MAGSLHSPADSLDTVLDIDSYYYPAVRTFAPRRHCPMEDALGLRSVVIILVDAETILYSSE